MPKKRIRLSARPPTGRDKFRNVWSNQQVNSRDNHDYKAPTMEWRSLISPAAYSLRVIFLARPIGKFHHNLRFSELHPVFGT